MSLFDQMVRGGGQEATPYYAKETGMLNAVPKPRTFKETIGDQIAYHQRKIDELTAVRDSLTPDVEKFVEALQRLG